MNSHKAVFPFLQPTTTKSDGFIETKSIGYKPIIWTDEPTPKQAFESMMPLPEWMQTTHPEKESGTSQSAQILAHMKAGNTITGLEALNRFGCFRLPARIADIKKMGYDVKSELITMNGKRVAQYWMEDL
jgi:hypothetical protein